jgi:hypothetical protein
LKSAEKTVAALNQNVACASFVVGNSGCWLDGCYLTQMGAGSSGLTYYKFGPYSGELLQM